MLEYQTHRDWPAKMVHIIGSAMSLVSRVGYKKLSITQLLRSAEVSKSTFYEFFESKEDLFGNLLWYYETQTESWLKAYQGTQVHRALLMRWFEEPEIYFTLIELEAYLEESDMPPNSFRRWHMLRLKNIERFSQMLDDKYSADFPELRNAWGAQQALFEGLVRMTHQPRVHDVAANRQVLFKAALAMIVKG